MIENINPSYESLLKKLRNIYEQSKGNSISLDTKQPNLSKINLESNWLQNLFTVYDTGDVTVTPIDQFAGIAPRNLPSLSGLHYIPTYDVVPGNLLPLTVSYDFQQNLEGITKDLIPFLEYQNSFTPPPNCKMAGGFLWLEDFYTGELYTATNPWGTIWQGNVPPWVWTPLTTLQYDSHMAKFTTPAWYMSGLVNQGSDFPGGGPNAFYGQIVSWNTPNSNIVDDGLGDGHNNYNYLTGNILANQVLSRTDTSLTVTGIEYQVKNYYNDVYYGPGGDYYATVPGAIFVGTVTTPNPQPIPPVDPRPSGPFPDGSVIFVIDGNVHRGNYYSIWNSALSGWVGNYPDTPTDETPLGTTGEITSILNNNATYVINFGSTDTTEIFFYGESTYTGLQNQHVHANNVDITGSHVLFSEQNGYYATWDAEHLDLFYVDWPPFAWVEPNLATDKPATFSITPGGELFSTLMADNPSLNPYSTLVNTSVPNYNNLWPVLVSGNTEDPYYIRQTKSTDSEEIWQANYSFSGIVLSPGVQVEGQYYAPVPADMTTRVLVTIRPPINWHKVDKYQSQVGN